MGIQDEMNAVMADVKEPTDGVERDGMPAYTRTPLDQRALIRVSPLQDDVIKAQIDNAKSALEYAQKRTITTLADAQAATNDLSMIAKLQKVCKGYLDEYTKPIKAHLDSIKADFDLIMKPLEEARLITRGKVEVYNLEQERKAREQEEINRLRVEAAQKEAALNNGEISEPVNLIETVHVPTIVRAEAGNSGMRDNWTYEVVDFAALPDEYKVPNTSLLNSLAKSIKDTRAIPGLRIFNNPTLVVKPR